MDLQLPPTPPMDLSDSNSNSSNDFKVSFIQKKVKQKHAVIKVRNKFPRASKSC